MAKIFRREKNVSSKKSRGDNRTAVQLEHGCTKFSNELLEKWPGLNSVLYNLTIQMKKPSSHVKVAGFESWMCKISPKMTHIN